MLVLAFMRHNMRSKIEELLDLKQTQLEQEDDEQDLDLTKDELFEQAKVIGEAMSTTEKLDLALSAVTGIHEHDAEFDDIANKALETYGSLVNLGLSVTENNAGDIFGVAAQMLKTALEARDSKVSRKLKMIDLMLKKKKLEDDAEKNASRNRTTEVVDENGETTAAVMMDRNEILKLIREKASQPSAQQVVETVDFIEGEDAASQEAEIDSQLKDVDEDDKYTNQETNL